MDYDLCIVHNADADAWRDYIVRLVSRYIMQRGAPPLRIDTVDDAKLRTKERALPRASVVIVILSPAHLDFLRHYQRNVNYRTLVDSRASNALVLRCGVPCFDDLADQDSAVFAQFFGWTKLDDVENGDPLMRAMSRLLPRRPSLDEVPTYVNPDKILGRHHSGPRSLSTANEPPSNRSSTQSNGGGSTTTPIDEVVFTTEEFSVSPCFRVIPTTIRCEVSSLLLSLNCPHN